MHVDTTNYLIMGTVWVVLLSFGKCNAVPSSLFPVAEFSESQQSFD